MSRTITIDRAGCTSGAHSDRSIMRALAQSIAKINCTGPLSDIVDNSGAVANGKFVLFPLAVVGAGNVGNNLASPADVATNLNTVRNAIKTLFAKANAAAAALGLAQVAYGGGGTDGSGTVAAVSTAVSGAASGPQDVESSAIIAAYNNSLYNLAILVNRIVEATGDDQLKINPSNVNVGSLGSIVSALAVSTTVAAASPGVPAAVWTTVFQTWAADIAAIAAALGTTLLPGTIRVIAVR